MHKDITMNITSRGELGYRLTKSNSRLECKYYLPEKIWTADKACWPGDWEGEASITDENVRILFEAG